MPSFISNFNRRVSSTRKLQPVVFSFLAAFSICCAVGEVLESRLPPLTVWQGGMPSLPSGDEYLFRMIFSPHDDIYDTYFYGIGNAIENAKHADVLLLGNSRMLFGFRAPAVRAFEKTTGLRVFNLCYPAGDGMPIVFETIRRFNLHPAIVIVNENEFFDHDSPEGVATAKKGFWRAWMDTRESEMAVLLNGVLHRWLPRFGLGKTRPAFPFMNVISLKDGCLVWDNFPPIRLAFNPGDHQGKVKLEYEKNELIFARWFKDQLDQRGIRMVLTNIPYDAPSVDRSRELAEKLHTVWLGPGGSIDPFCKATQLAKDLGVPLVVPEIRELETFDGSHLTEAGSQKFASAFFRRFLLLPEVKSLIEKGRLRGNLKFSTGF